MVKIKIPQPKIKLLKDYFSQRPEVLMAFVFGSYAKNRQISESDLDIAVYFKPAGRILEWEETKFYEPENKIWGDVERIVGINTDLVVLNRSRSTLAFEILKTGIPLIIKDRKLYWEFYLTISREAEDYRSFIKDYWSIYQRSHSLSEEDKAKLIERIQFLDLEIKEFSDYKNINLKTYQEDKIQRRNIERWIETLINAVIDVAKIVLASEKKKMPATYNEVLLDFTLLAGFGEDKSQQFSQFAKLRNFLAHEYLDIRFNQLKKFIQEAEPFYKELIEYVKKMI